MPSRADEMITALRTGHEALVERVRGLSGDDLARPSGASEWDVSQVLSHLGSGAEIGLAVIDTALDDSGAPGAPDMDFARDVWSRWDAMSRADRAERFVTANDALLRRYEGLDDAAKENLRVDMGFLPAPVDMSVVAGMRLSEFTHHAWDVRVAFDPAAELAPEAVPLLFGQAAQFVGLAGRAAELGEARPVTIAVRTTAPDRSFGLNVDESVAVVDAPEQPDAVLTTPAEWWLRLVFGRHGAAYTPPGVTLTGGTLTLDDLRAVFPGF